MEGTTLTAVLTAVAGLLTMLGGALVWVTKQLLTVTLPDLANKGMAELAAERAANRDQLKEDRAASRDEARLEREFCERRHQDVLTLMRAMEAAAAARHEQNRGEMKDTRHRIGGLDLCLAAILDRLRLERPPNPPLPPEA